MTFAREADLQPFVDRLMARSVLSADEQHAILTLPTQRLEVLARHDFVRLKEETRSSCFVASGLVGRFGYTRKGARQITAFHIPGDVADLHSAVRPIGIGGLTALCDTTILQIPHNAIRRLSATYPAIAEAFWRDCMLDAAILMQWVVNVGRRDAKTRLAHVFCEMAIRTGGDRQTIPRYNFPVTQEQLGDATAMTSVHLNRVVQSFRKEKLISFIGGIVHILQWDALAKIGEFDSTYLLGDTAPDRQSRLLTAA